MENQVLEATQRLEKQLDNEISNLNNLEQHDFESLREKRLAALKEQQQQKQKWLARGHSEYQELADEKEFFACTKASLNVVCHFYRESTPRCKIVDKHLSLIAAKHVETRFVKIDVEKCQFLAERLRIVVMPTVALVREGKVLDYIVGFDDMGGIDDFPTEIMEWRIARSSVINYEGDIAVPPVLGSKKNLLKKTSCISGGTKHTDNLDSSDDEY